MTNYNPASGNGPGLSETKNDASELEQICVLICRVIELNQAAMFITEQICLDAGLPKNERVVIDLNGRLSSIEMWASEAFTLSDYENFYRPGATAPENPPCDFEKMSDLLWQMIDLSDDAQTIAEQVCLAAGLSNHEGVALGLNGCLSTIELLALQASSLVNDAQAKI